MSEDDSDKDRGLREGGEEDIKEEEDEEEEDEDEEDDEDEDEESGQEGKEGKEKQKENSQRFTRRQKKNIYTGTYILLDVFMVHFI